MTATPLTHRLTGNASLDPTPAPVPPVVRLTDGLLDAIAASLGSAPPERGGVLLGVGALTHLFLEDTRGRYSAVSWDISTELTTAIAALESAGRGVLTGTVHSHPAGIPDPSATDLKTTTRALQMNPHLDRLLIAVVPQPSCRGGQTPNANGGQSCPETFRPSGASTPVTGAVQNARSRQTGGKQCKHTASPRSSAQRSWPPVSAPP